MQESSNNFSNLLAVVREHGKDFSMSAYKNPEEIHKILSQHRFSSTSFLFLSFHNNRKKLVLNGKREKVENHNWLQHTNLHHEVTWDVLVVQNPKGWRREKNVFPSRYSLFSKWDELGIKLLIVCVYNVACKLKRFSAKVGRRNRKSRLRFA